MLAFKIHKMYWIQDYLKAVYEEIMAYELMNGIKVAVSLCKTMRDKGYS